MTIKYFLAGFRRSTTEMELKNWIETNLKVTILKIQRVWSTIENKPRNTAYVTILNELTEDELEKQRLIPLQNLYLTIAKAKEPPRKYATGTYVSSLQRNIESWESRLEGVQEVISWKQKWRKLWIYNERYRFWPTSWETRTFVWLLAECEEIITTQEWLHFEGQKIAWVRKLGRLLAEIQERIIEYKFFNRIQKVDEKWNKLKLSFQYLNNGYERKYKKNKKYSKKEFKKMKTGHV